MGIMIATVLAGTGCGGGGGGGEASLGYPAPPPTGGGGGSGTALAGGQTVGRIALDLPDLDTFVVRATLPTPPDTYPRADGKQPFGLVDQDGTTVGAQAEVVTWFPDENRGASVVEVLGVVNRPAGAQAGDRMTYDVVLAPHDPVADPGSADVGDLWTGPMNVPQSVQDMLADPSSIVIRATDCFGNVYEARPLDGGGNATLKRHGEHQAQLRVFQNMVPAPAVGGPSGTLPHFLGTHSYLSTLNGETVLPFDLRITNGHSGNDPADPGDDPLGEVYFDRIEVLVPNGWTVVQDHVDPLLGGAYVEGAMTVHPIVNSLTNIGNGGLHWMPWLAQFHRRLAICGLGEEDRAREMITGGGVGFAERGDDGAGGELWSWWNDATAHYFPQQHILPSLDHLGGQTENQLAADLAKAAGHLANGSATGLYPFVEPRLGWAHPYGIAYGGMTGGAEIHLFDGVMTAAAGSRSGYQLHRIVHRMATDRMPVALYDGDGEPSSVEDWVQTAGGLTYVPFDFFSKPIGSSDPFGLGAAPTFQQTYVTGAGLEPAYKATLATFQHHDYQHLIRYTRTPKVLTWLANDALAKDDLLLMAETFHLGYHQHANSSGGYVQGTGLLFDQQAVAADPGKGVDFGRGEAWGLDAMVCAYATGDTAWRDGKRPWFDAIANLLNDGQGACNGFVQATISQQFVGGKYRARQMIEQSITETALRGMNRSVYAGLDAGMTAMNDAVLEDSLYAAISDMAWFPGESGPWLKAAVGPLDVNLPVWCSWTQMPGDAFVPAYDTYQNWSSFAYGYELTADPTFLSFGSLQAGNPDLLGQLEADGLENIANKAGLLALMQWLGGDI